MRRLLPLLLLYFLMHAVAQQPTGTTPPPVDQAPAAGMLPSEAFDYATQPFNQARAQPNDLTEADRWALSVTIQRAGRACLSLTPYKQFNEQLLSVGRLCVLGQQFEQAAEALVPYLSVPNAKYEEGGLLLSRAYIGMGQLTTAESQLETLMARFPYDAGIHYGIDNLIEAAEGGNKEDEQLVQRLDAQQLPFMLKALNDTVTVVDADKNSSVSTALLFEDSLRCAAGLRADGKQKDAAEIARQLETLAAGPKYAQSSQLPLMQSALKRYQMIGEESPLNALRGHLVPHSGPAQLHTVTLRGKTIVLIAISLASPASIDVINKMTTLVNPAGTKQTAVAIYALTSYSANGGDEDHPAAGLTQALQSLAQALPATPLYIVPDAALQAFAIDQCPLAVMLDTQGRMRFSAPLVTDGDERLLRDAVLGRAPEPIVVQAEPGAH